jgi:hypothetical protein
MEYKVTVRFSEIPNYSQIKEIIGVLKSIVPVRHSGFPGNPAQAEIKQESHR